MSKTYRPYKPKQMFLLPPSPQWALITATHNLRKLYTVAPGSFRGAGAVFAGG